MPAGISTTLIPSKHFDMDSVAGTEPAGAPADDRTGGGRMKT